MLSPTDSAITTLVIWKKLGRVTLDEKLKQLRLIPIDGDSFAPPTESEIHLLEGRFGKSIPVEYRTFFASYGECMFEVLCKLPTKGGGIIPGIFFSLSDFHDVMDCLDDLPEYVLPINDDGGGNVICISARDDHTHGCIYFKNHNFGWDDSRMDVDAAKFDTMYLMSKSFDNFILALEPDP